MFSTFGFDSYFVVGAAPEPEPELVVPPPPLPQPTAPPPAPPLPTLPAAVVQQAPELLAS